MPTHAPLLPITIYRPDEPWSRQRTATTLESLLADDDGLREEEAAIRATLARGECYGVGGGAAPYCELHAHTDLSSLIPADRLMGLDEAGLCDAYDAFLALTKARSLSADELLSEISDLPNTWAECRWLSAFIRAWEAADAQGEDDPDDLSPYGGGILAHADMREIGVLVGGVW